MSIRVLVVDDSALFGRVLKHALEMIPGLEVAGQSRTGDAALDRLRAEHVDLATLDIEMPGTNGLDLLLAMRREGIKTAAVMVSSASDRARELTMRALQLGALDFIPKPQGGSPEEILEQLRERLVPIVAAVGHRKEVQDILRGSPRNPVLTPSTPSATIPVEEYGRNPHAPAVRPAAIAEVPRPARRRHAPKPAMVLIGVSTGGPEALGRIIPALPGTLRVPVLIVQHMPPLFTQTLAQKLDSSSALRVSEARDGETAIPGHVYLAPGGKHLKVAQGRQSEIVLRITGDPPENNCRPAVDVLFRSAANAFPGLSVAVILTGMGRDGTLGLRDLRESGVTAIAQDEATCTVYGMPKEAVQAGLIDIVTPLHSVASEIVRAVA